MTIYMYAPLPFVKFACVYTCAPELDLIYILDNTVTPCM